MFKYFQAYVGSLTWPNKIGDAAAITSTFTPVKRKRRHPLVVAVRELVYRHIGVHTRQRRVQAERREDVGLEAYLQSHVCLHPFERVDATHRGLAHVCCSDWLPTPIGDLGSDLLKQWSGPVCRR